jgi:hypothetical protein
MLKDLIQTTPFEKGDLVRGEDGRTETYFGPTFRMTFPAGTDVQVHKKVLSTLGYRTKVDSEISIFIYGNFSDAEREDYQTVYHAQVELVKERGVSEPCPWRKNE